MSENQCQKICVNRSAEKTVIEQGSASVSLQQPCGDGIAAPAFEIEEKLNDLYEKRLAEINEQANGDASLKEITYKEWITMLRQINTTLINNIQEIDCETTKRLNLLQKKAGTNCRHDQTIEICKYRNDRDNLVQLIRNARQNDDWKIDGLKFETISEQDIFGESLCCQSNVKKEIDTIKQSSSMDQKTCAAQKCKLMTHLKSLAMEIAERHDEMRDLKRQVISLEDDILNAQKKIQLKDDVIRELRNDLKTFPKSAATWGRRVSERLSPLDCFPTMMSEGKISECSEMDLLDTPRAGSCKNRDSINSINLSEFSFPFQEDDEEEVLIKQLKDELAQLQETYEQNFGHQKQELKESHSRFSKMVDKMDKTNHEQQIKLQFFRRELLNLENPQSCSRFPNDEDSGISSDVESDARIVTMVRNRINCLLGENRRLQQEEQRLKIEKEDFISQFTAKSTLLDKTSKALREVADTISIAICKPINYEDIFRTNSTSNPIVDALGELLNSQTERDNLIAELRAKINNTVKTNQELQANTDDLQEQLCELKNSIVSHSQSENRGKLFQNEEFTRNSIEKAEPYRDKSSDTPHHQTNHNEYLRIINDLSSDLNTLSCQVNMVQNEFLNDDCAVRFETSLKVLEEQNDLLQGAIDKLTLEKTTLDQTLRAKNEELKNTVCFLEQKICFLEKKIDEYQRKPCGGCEGYKNRPSAYRTSSDEKLQTLESELKRKCRIVENLKSENEELKQELTEIRRNRAKTKLLQRREPTSDRLQSNQQHQEILHKLNAAQQTNMEQCKSLQKASKQIASLQEEIDELQANTAIHNKERLLLNTELTSLKECQASQMGTEQSLKDQLQRTTNELYVTKEKLAQCCQEHHQLDTIYRDEKKRLQEKNALLIESHNNLIEDYNKIVQEYQKLVQIDEEKNKIISAFEEWKRNQIELDKEMQKKKQLLEDHIKELLKNKIQLLNQLEETENVNIILKDTLENSMFNLSGNQSSIASGSLRRYNNVSAANSSQADPVSKLIADIRHTTRRVSQQRSILEDEAVNLPK